MPTLKELENLEWIGSDLLGGDYVWNPFCQCQLCGEKHRKNSLVKKEKLLICWKCEEFIFEK